NAARVQAGAAEGIRTILVHPLIDTRDLELVLAGADGGGITGGTTADDDDVVLGHASSATDLYLGNKMGTTMGAARAAPMIDVSDYSWSSRRAGSSNASLIATRNCTDSRPSTMRWS